MPHGDSKRNQFTNPWTTSEVQMLRSLVEGAQRSLAGKLKKGEGTRIAALFPGRSRHSVEHQISILGSEGKWEKKHYRAWTDEEELKLRALYSGEKWRLNLSKEFPDRNPRDILEKARLLGLSRRILKTEAKVLTDMQKGILAGLIMGDGCLSHRIAGHGRKQHINSIEFSNTDPGLVEQFASMVTNCTMRTYKATGSFHRKKVNYAASVSSREAVRNILNQILPCLAGEKLLKAREMLICLEGGHV
jgi:hypothetical protein